MNLVDIAGAHGCALKKTGEFGATSRVFQQTIAGVLEQKLGVMVGEDSPEGYVGKVPRFALETRPVAGQSENACDERPKQDQKNKRDRERFVAAHRLALAFGEKVN